MASRNAALERRFDALYERAKRTRLRRPTGVRSVNPLTALVEPPRPCTTPPAQSPRRPEKKRKTVGGRRSRGRATLSTHQKRRERALTLSRAVVLHRSATARFLFGPGLRALLRAHERFFEAFDELFVRRRCEWLSREAEHLLAPGRGSLESVAGLKSYVVRMRCFLRFTCCETCGYVPVADALVVTTPKIAAIRGKSRAHLLEHVRDYFTVRCWVCDARERHFAPPGRNSSSSSSSNNNNNNNNNEHQCVQAGYDDRVCEFEQLKCSPAGTTACSRRRCLRFSRDQVGSHEAARHAGVLQPCPACRQVPWVRLVDRGLSRASNRMCTAARYVANCYSLEALKASNREPMCLDCAQEFIRG